MNLDTILIQAFIAVAETGSFTRAAERINRTQSAVSQQISKLEKMLDVALFDRHAKMELTSEGEIFLGYARQIFTLHQEVLDRFREPELQGEVRFGIPEDFASVYLADVLADFAHLHPRIMLNIQCDLTYTLYERFKRKEFDLVLVKMNRPEDFPHGLEVWSESLEWAGQAGVVDPGKPLPLVLSPPPCVYRERTVEVLGEAGKSWRPVFSSPSYAGTIAAVQAGMGITSLPGTMIPESLRLIDERLPDLRDIHVSMLKHETDNAAVNSFEGFVLRKLRH